MITGLFNHERSLSVKVILLLFIFFIPDLKAQYTENHCAKANSVFQTIEKYHFQPIQINNQWSNNVFQIFLNLLDPQGLTFTQSDYKKLLIYKDSIDDYINNCKGAFFSSLIDIYSQRLKEIDTLISQIMAKPFNYLEKDTLILYNDTIVYAKNSIEIKQRWKNLLKYRTLYYLLSAESPEINLQRLMIKEPEARNIILRKQKQRIRRLICPREGIENQIAEQLYNAIALSFDPHTSYFTLSEKNNFEESLSAEQYIYGFETDETETGEIEIIKLAPGGPAWKSNELHKGDIMLNVKWPNGESVDLTLLNNDELENLFESSTFREMELTVRKSNNQIKTVKLRKEKISADENLIKSFLLKGNHNIGYISLPGFYTEWDNDMPSGCSTDMAKEIIKLQKESIDGIIIDLRFNGGGSLGEALSLAGIFIDDGPLSIIKNRNNKPVVLKDYNRGTIYDGPLLLLVNSYSASASEILAAALQNYNRAIIVGSPTYGKATSQIITSVEQTPETNNQPNSFVKVTTGKIYRITGKSHQNTGVMPDIILPDFIDLEQRESSSINALKNDSVSKKTIYKPLPELPIKQLAERSNNRQLTNSGFRQIKLFNDSISFLRNKKQKIPLYYNSFLKTEWNFYQNTKHLDSVISKKQNTYTVTNNKYDQQIIDLSPYASETNTELKKNIQNDIYIEECYQIMNDLLIFKTN